MAILCLLDLNYHSETLSSPFYTSYVAQMYSIRKIIVLQFLINLCFQRVYHSIHPLSYS